MTKTVAISLWQPWASAIAAGLKKFETRSWPTSYRGPLAIHASRQWNGELAVIHNTLRVEFPEYAAAMPRMALPFGCIVATCTLANCVKIDAALYHRLPALEIALGNYASGRYAWELTDVRAIVEPIPWRGGQGFFNVTLP